MRGLAVVVMGPSACGKSELASALADHYGCQFIDADSLHSPANIEKMRNGTPLTDEDRTPWLQTVRQQTVSTLESEIISKKSEVKSDIYVTVACSALRKCYRDILRGEPATPTDDLTSFFKVVFVFVHCSPEVLQKRISERKGHFMKAQMLQSQLNVLERPTPDELCVVVNGNECLQNIVSEAVEKLEKLSLDF